MQTIRLINRGGFGEVHEVEVNWERIARKTFKCPLSAVGDPSAEAKFKKRFAREVRIQSRLSHPNILPIIGSDLTAGTPWFTMPLAEESLETFLNNRRATGNFEGQIDINVWQDMLAGTEELHRLGYVHRDLKPANVLRIGNAWRLADFGLILPTVRESTILTSSQSAYGSHFYAAPEQARDFRNVPEQTDIFALGCVLHDFVEASPSRVPFSQIKISGAYSDVIAKCTEPDPRNRYATISAVRAAIFEVYNAQRADTDLPEESDRVNAVIENPHSVECWSSLIRHIEDLEGTQKHLKLQSISSTLIRALQETDLVLFARLMALICDWARSTGFDWNYCDVVGDRLLDAYRISPVRIRCDIVLSALELAVSHNRWHVMNQVGAMLGQTAESGLVDRIIIEIDLKDYVADNLTRIEDVIHWPRENWHPILADFLTTSSSAVS